MDPSTLITQNSSLVSFSLAQISSAYKSTALFDSYKVSYVIGGLHASTPPIDLSSESPSNCTLSLTIFHPSTIEIYEGFNTFTELLVKTESQAGVLELSLPSGLYTVLSYSPKRVTFKRNLNLFTDIHIEMLSFPSSINEAFTVQLLSPSSHLQVDFTESPSQDCELSSKYPRCGGSRIFRYKDSEIFAVKEVSASFYLVYVTGESFEHDSIKFYSKGFSHEHFEIFGKSQKNNEKFWIVFCVNGRLGVNSLEIVDVYSESLDPQVCKGIYGNLTWTQEELKKGLVRVGK